MPHSRALLAAALAVLLAPAAAAQTPPPPAPPGADLLAPEPETDLVIEPPVDERMVEVSLGDWGVKNEVASALQVGLAEVPLTVVVDTGLAAEVCPISRDDLTEQSVVAATRTCAAKTYVPALADKAREQMRPLQR